MYLEVLSLCAPGSLSVMAATVPAMLRDKMLNLVSRLNANSPLVSQILFKSNSVTRMTTTKQYDYLNRLTAISNAPASGVAVSHGYAYNAANQRTRDTLVDNSYWVYQYDSLGQVTSRNTLSASWHYSVSSKLLSKVLNN